MKTIENQTFDMERALYGSQDILVKNCSFDGPADGESALKESSDIDVEHCFCNLRYPFWHDHRLKIADSEMTPFAVRLCGIPTMWRSQIQSFMELKLSENAAILS